MLRLLADDLTGALDTTAELVPLTGAVPVLWPSVTPSVLAGSAALDSGTRELSTEDATDRVARLCPHLLSASIAFKKIDSLMRGATMAEIAACLRMGAWRYAVLAPAFPFQDRVTRNGRQFARIAGTWTAVSPPLCDALQMLGVSAVPGAPGRPLHAGVTVLDATTDDDLRAIALAEPVDGSSVLWIGTGGLAQALAAGHAHPTASPLPRPILGIFGSDQPATASQLEACAEHWLETAGQELDLVAKRLDAAGLALVSFSLAPNLARHAAAAEIAERTRALVARIDPPGTIMVAGGETLRSLCDAVDAESLLVTGRLVPGVPRSVIQGGRWNGVTVISKSGAFGPPDLLRRLLLTERNAS
jgi:uncharacterized protein YgbK (DUF1537 family)